jgi:signal transduction histidine kinase
MELHVTRKILSSELLLFGLIHLTLTPFILLSMQFPPAVILQYLAVTSVVLYPLMIAISSFFITPWECRPITMLDEYLERRASPPDDVVQEARIRILNLPVIHTASFFIRYELAMVLACLYLGVTGVLSLPDTILLAIHGTIGMLFLPIFSFFLTERFLFSTRQAIARRTRDVAIDESRVIHISLRTRLVTTLLATVTAPLIALGFLMYRRIGKELNSTLLAFAQDSPVMTNLFTVLSAVTFVTLLLTTVIGVLLVASISHPLEHILNAIRQVEKGNLRIRSKLLTNDELGVLSQSFDTMAQEIEKGRADLETLNRSLEVRIAEKTENLTRALDQLRSLNHDLELANNKLMELDKLKSDFISVVSHELRTPLTSIKAYTELIPMKPHMTIEKRDRFLSIINNETDRLTRLISDILDHTKIEAGKLSWNVTEVFLPEIIRSSVANIQTLADHKNLEVRLVVPDSLPRLYGDRDRLMQVITNILSNAIKFTPDGGTIRIEAFSESSPFQQIVVRIKDSGVGISPQQLDAVFEKFQHSGDAMTDGREGTGLSLAISRQIVEYHGGRIWAESVPGKGSTFTFTLPLDKTWKIDGNPLKTAVDL